MVDNDGDRVKELIVELSKSSFKSGYIMGKGGPFDTDLIVQVEKAKDTYDRLLLLLGIKPTDDSFNVLSCG